MFDKSYPLSMVKGYVSHWGLPQAIREFIQNAIDSPSPFVYEFEHVDAVGWRLSLTSVNTVLTPETLLLGATSKTHQATAIGSFGEGFKLAMLVLTRLGYDCEMLNGDKVWRPRFKFSKAFQTEILVIDEHDGDSAHEGLTVVIEGLSDGDKQAVVDSCLMMQTDTGKLETPYGDIHLERQGQLYVGGLFICKTQLKYGYDIKPEHITLERDRETVSDYDLEALTLMMWIETGNNERIAEMIEAEIPDVNHARYSVPDKIREACYTLFKKRHPNALVAVSQNELRDMVERGLTDTVFVGGGYGSAITSSSSYRRDAQVVQMIELTPADILHKWVNSYGKPLGVKARKEFQNVITESQRWRRK